MDFFFQIWGFSQNALRTLYIKTWSQRMHWTSLCPPPLLSSPQPFGIRWKPPSEQRHCQIKACKRGACGQGQAGVGRGRGQERGGACWGGGTRAITWWGKKRYQKDALRGSLLTMAAHLAVWLPPTSSTGFLALVRRAAMPTCFLKLCRNWFRRTKRPLSYLKWVPVIIP